MGEWDSKVCYAPCRTELAGGSHARKHPAQDAYSRLCRERPTRPARHEGTEGTQYARTARTGMNRGAPRCTEDR